MEAIANRRSESCGAGGDAVGASAVLCRGGELETGLKAVASGLKDVARCGDAETGRSMLGLLSQLLASCRLESSKDE